MKTKLGLFILIMVQFTAVAALAGTSVTVSAAASLKEIMDFAKQGFEKDHPDVEIEVNLGGSGALVQQIQFGAPVDIFVSAGEKPMNRLVQLKLVDSQSIHVLARNQLQLIQPNNGVPLKSLNDLTAPGVTKIALGEPGSVPAGQYAEEALRKAQLWDNLQSKIIFLKDVRQVLTTVETGNVEAGFVYVTDSLSSSRVHVVLTLPPTLCGPITYPFSVLKSAHQPRVAKEFADYLLGPAVQAQLKGLGFRIQVSPL